MLFYYSVPTLDVLHKHLGVHETFKFVTMAVRGLCQPWKSPGRIKKTSWAIELDITDIWWKFQPDRTGTSRVIANRVKFPLLCRRTEIGQVGGGMDQRPREHTRPITVRTKIGQRGIDLGLSYKYGCERRLNGHSYSFRPKSFLGKSRHSDFQL